MKQFTVFLVVLLICSVCFADRVCLKKSDGKLIEFQSGNAPLGTLIQNAIVAGYNASDVEEKYITKAEWVQIKYDNIIKPAEDKQKEKNKKIKSGKGKLKALGLTQTEIDSLF